MKSIIEQYNVRRHVESTESDDPSFPILGRLSRSPVKRLARAYRDRVPVAMLVSRSRFSPGYVVDRFLADIDTLEASRSAGQAAGSSGTNGTGSTNGAR